MSDADVVVVGGGIVGLATAFELQGAGFRVTVLERHPELGLEQSTHNSEVIHSGAFVHPGTLRSSLVVEGNRRLFAVAKELGVRAEQCGTLAVARTPAELPRLDEYAHWARANGVPGSERVDTDGVRRREPKVARVEAGLWLPTGGRIDVRGLIAAVHRRLEIGGTTVLRGWEVGGARRSSGAWELAGSRGERLSARVVVNSAGVHADDVARQMGATGARTYPCLGEYARVTSEKKEWVRSMVYGFPAPGYPGIGVHLTRRVDGELLIGPTATYLPGPDPPPRPLTSLEEFAEKASQLLPGITAEDLAPERPGMRAKLIPPGSREPFGDFVFQPEPEGAGALHLLGIESPGLTASFAIGERVVAWVKGLTS